MEVDTPIMSRFAPVDEHIEVFSLLFTQDKKVFLHSSPEYAMKRLLVQGMGDIYQMGHVFRKEESGRLHNPEFTMVEWYRLHIDYQAFIEETVQFLNIFLGGLSYTLLSYREAFLQFSGLDYLTASSEQIIEVLLRRGVFSSQDLCRWDRQTLLYSLLSFIIEPRLGKNGFTVLFDYPAQEAALARTFLKGDERVAERFEIYYEGIELANGYHELADPLEQRRRFEEANSARIKAGKEILPIDEEFLSDLAKGLPDCCGVAIGFDRCMLLRHKAQALSDVMPFTWQ